MERPGPMPKTCQDSYSSLPEARELMDAQTPRPLQKGRSVRSSPWTITMGRRLQRNHREERKQLSPILVCSRFSSRLFLTQFNPCMPINIALDWRAPCLFQLALLLIRFFAPSWVDGRYKHQRQCRACSKWCALLCFVTFDLWLMFLPRYWGPFVLDGRLADY